MHLCPRCRGREVRGSQRRGVLELVVLRVLLVRPLRCANCNLRFFRLSSWRPEPLPEPLSLLGKESAFADLEQAVTAKEPKPSVTTSKRTGGVAKKMMAR